MATLDIADMATILVVDDTPENLALMSGLLKDDYRVKVANSGEKALRIATGDPRPDLILLDIMMPELDGYEVCRKLKADRDTRDIPVIFLTVRAEADDGSLGFALGAVDYITKPFSTPTILARVKTHLALKAAADFLRDKNEYLELEVARRIGEVMAIQDVAILMMASLAETRDNETGNHIRRTQHYVKALAEKLQNHPRFARFLTERNILMLFKSAPLHDIGKVGIPDRILLKPGRLDPEEMIIMKTHAALGGQTVEYAEKTLGKHAEFLQTAREIAQSHHEKWDGSGYPEGLSGDAIPISARLMALADVYDALISRRVYKEPMPHENAVEFILAGKAAHFDPDIVDAFLAIVDEFRAIADRYRDPEHVQQPS